MALEGPGVWQEPTVHMRGQWYVHHTHRFHWYIKKLARGNHTNIFNSLFGFSVATFVFVCFTASKWGQERECMFNIFIFCSNKRCAMVWRVEIHDVWWVRYVDRSKIQMWDWGTKTGSVGSLGQNYGCCISDVNKFLYYISLHKAQISLDTYDHMVVF